VPIFDLDGTLLDSDAALAAAFDRLGVAPEAVTFGHVIGEECRRLGLSLEAYVAAYDTGAAQPFPDVAELLARLPRWAVCSNKHRGSARAELQRLGWRPEAALFSEDFGGPKRLEPVLAALGVTPERAIFVGDTDHDRACAQTAGVRFALAAWNPRAAPSRGDRVLRNPSQLLPLCLEPGDYGDEQGSTSPAPTVQ
jgi:HAD superfamily hydrolase (TIGR01549 family)